MLTNWLISTPLPAACLQFLHYAWGSLMANQFSGDRNKVFISNNGTDITILDYYSLGSVSPWEFLGIEFAFFIAFFGLAFMALRFVRHEKR